MIRGMLRHPHGSRDAMQRREQEGCPSEARRRNERYFSGLAAGGGGARARGSAMARQSPAVW